MARIFAVKNVCIWLWIASLKHGFGPTMRKNLLKTFAEGGMHGNTSKVFTFWLYSMYVIMYSHNHQSIIYTKNV